MDAFPAFVALAGARVVVAGEGPAADAKARLFDGSPAVLVRLAGPEAVDEAACAGARLVFVASDDEAAARAAATRARAAGAWVNVVDRPALSDFATPSIVDRGTVTGAVGTVGAAPVLAVRLRQELETRWPERLGEVARLLQAMRGEARATLDGMDARRRYFTRLLDGPAAALALAGDREGALLAARKALAAEGAPVGRAALIALPPAPDLLTLRAARRLGAADRVFADAGVDAALLALARRDAPREPVDVEAVRTRVAEGENVAVLARTGEALAAALAAGGVAVERVWEGPSRTDDGSAPQGAPPGDTPR